MIFFLTYKTATSVHFKQGANRNALMDAAYKDGALGLTIVRIK